MIDSALPPLLFPVPEQLSLADATTIIGGADAALVTVNQLSIKPNETILLTGASGSVGTYLLQLLKQCGIRVVTVAHSSNQQLLKDLGADLTLSYDTLLPTQLSKLPDLHAIIDLAGAQELLTMIAANAKLTKFFH